MTLNCAETLLHYYTITSQCNEGFTHH